MKRNVLNPRQKTFVREYLIDLNATAAYKRAGYKDTPAAEHNAARLMGNDKVRSAIDCAMAERAKRTEISADQVVRELALVAFNDIGEVLDFCGTDVRLKAASDIPEAVRRVLESIKVRRYVEGAGDNARDVEVIEFKFLDKLQALVKLGQHLGLFTAAADRPDPDGEIIPLTVVEVVSPNANVTGR